MVTHLQQRCRRLRIKEAHERLARVSVDPDGFHSPKDADFVDELFIRRV